MGLIEEKYETISDAFESLRKSIALVCRAAQTHNRYPEEEILAFRDSLIQRFEYCVDLAWKYLKEYLESELQVVPQLVSPKHVIRASAKAAMISEKEAEAFMEMIEARNKTSHIYREEIAEMLRDAIPAYYEAMWRVVQRLSPKTDL